MKVNCLLLLLILPLTVHAGSKLQCLSGDCRNGEGEAFLEEHVYYKGSFKKGAPHGEGYLANWGWVHQGAFKEGWRQGYGIDFQAVKGADDRYRADSSQGVTIGTWATGMLAAGIRILPDGTETYYTTNGFVNGKRPADAWMNAQADGYQAMLRGKSVVRPATTNPAPKREGYQCISGDCQNGTGTAVRYQSDGQMDYYYSGRFENGQLVDGTQINYSWAYVGGLKNDKYDGYGVRFDAKKEGLDYVIDSSSFATFAKWKDGDIVMAAGVSSTGDRDWYAKGKEVSAKKVNDDWINQHADAFFKSRAGRFRQPDKPTVENLTVAKNRVNIGRNTWAFVIEWDCLPDRVYYLTASNHANYGYLPFAGVVMAQISGEDKLVVAEGEISRANPGTRWESMRAFQPAKAGRYTFLLRFYQDEITGGRKEDYVSGVQLDWELHSSRKL